jgi:MOSC domain-containing protein YiiM
MVFELDPAQSRRYIVTSNVPLNHIVGRAFRVAEATLLGLKLCEPCSHLEKSSKNGIKQGFIHGRGLRGWILTGGFIRDEVEEVG